MEFSSGGQRNKDNSLIRIRGVEGITVTKSTFTNCMAGCIDAEGVSNSNFIENVFYKATRFHFRAEGSSNFNFSYNYMV